MDTNSFHMPRSRGILPLEVSFFLTCSPYRNTKQHSDVETNWVLITKVIGNTALILG